MKLSDTVIIASLLLLAYADLYKDCQNICGVRYKCGTERGKATYCTKYPNACMNACRANKAQTKKRWTGKQGCYNQCQRRYSCNMGRETCTHDFEKCHKHCLEGYKGLEYAKYFQSCMQKGKCYTCSRCASCREASCYLNTKCLDFCPHLKGNAQPFWDCQKKGDAEKTAMCLQEAFDKAFKW